MFYVLYMSWSLLTMTCDRWTWRAYWHYFHAAAITTYQIQGDSRKRELSFHQKSLWNGNYSRKTVIFFKFFNFLKFCKVKSYCYHSSFLKKNGFYVAVAISKNCLWNGDYIIEFKKPLFFQKINEFRNTCSPLCPIEGKITSPFVWEWS